MTPRNDIPHVPPAAKVAVWVLLAIFGLACLFGLGWLLARLV